MQPQTGPQPQDPLPSSKPPNLNNRPLEVVAPRVQPSSKAPYRQTQTPPILMINRFHTQTDPPPNPHCVSKWVLCGHFKKLKMRQQVLAVLTDFSQALLALIVVG